MSDHTVILERIRKLYALAGNNPSEAEAQAAMLKAQELLLANGLSVSDVDMASASAAAPRDEVNTEGAESDPLGTSLREWMIDLGKVVADNFRCYVVLWRKAAPARAYHSPEPSIFGGYYRKPEPRAKSSRAIRFFGLSRDADAARDTFNFAVRAAGSLYTQYARRFGGGGQFDYMAGFVAGLRDKFTAQVTTKALAIVKPQQVVAWWQAQKWGKDRTRRRTGNAGSHAGEAGYRDGRSLGERHRSITA